MVIATPGGVRAAAALDETTSSPDVTIEIDGVLTNDEDATVESGAPSALIDLGTLPASAEVAAYHREDSGNQLFVLDTTASLSGAGTVEPRDVVRYDGATYSVAFDGSAEGVPNGARVDAVTQEEDGDLILSFDTTIAVGSVTAGDEDLVLFDSVGGPALFLDASAAGASSALDLDSAHYIRASQNLLVSFDTSGTVGGVTFDDEDVLEYDSDGGTWELSVDAASAEPNWLAADLSAFHAMRSCASLGGDGDSDLLCDDEDPCDTYPNVLPVEDFNGDGIPNECQCGDANEDGFILFADAQIIAACVLSPGTCTADISIAEANNDTFLLFADAQLVASVLDPGSPLQTFDLTCARRPSGLAPPALP